MTVTLTGPFNWDGNPNDSAQFTISADVDTIAEEIVLEFVNTVTGKKQDLLFFPVSDLKTSPFNVALVFAKDTPTIMPTTCGGSGNKITATAFVTFIDGSTATSNTNTFTIIAPCPTVTLGPPENADGTAWTANSSDNSFWGLTANIDTLAVSATLIFKNLITGAKGEVAFTFGTGVDLRTSPQFLKVNFNAQLPSFADPICGAQDGCTAQAVVFFSDGTTLSSEIESFVITREPCVCTEILDVFTTLPATSGCLSIDGTIGIQGKLFECTCATGGGCSGIPSPFVSQLSAVQIGLQDPVTGIFYDYIPGAPTDTTGTFSIAFTPKQRSDVVALIPPSGSKTFNLQAFFAGSLTHKPSNVFSTPVSVSGEMGPACPLGTLVKDTVYAFPPPAGETIHVITQGFTAGLVVGGVTLSIENIADKVTSTVHDAIVAAGAAPLEIKVYAGPVVEVPIFFGFLGVPSQAFNVVATATGSPIAALILALAIIVALALLVFFIFLTFSVIKDTISKGPGAAVLLVGGIAVIAVAGVAGYLLFSQRKAITRALGG